MLTTVHTMRDTGIGPQRQIGRLLAIAALMLMSGGLGALGAIAWEEYWKHEPLVVTSSPAPSAASVSARGRIGGTPFSAEANRDAKGFGFDIKVGPQTGDAHD